MNINVLDVRKGDIVRFAAYSLRVEQEPVISKGSILLEGRISIDGCQIVRKRFLGGRVVSVDRAGETK